MKKVVIDARNINGTTGRYTENLLRNLRADDMKFVALVPSSYERTASLPKAIELVRCDIVFGSLAEQTRLPRVIRNLKPDLAHFTMSVKPLLYTAPCVTSILDLTATRFGPNLVKKYIYSRIVRSGAKKSKHIIAISNYVKNDIVRTFKISPGKITVTHNAADKITEAPIPLNRVKGADFILYTGRPQPHKNLKRLLSAFSELHKLNPKLKLVLAGRKDTLFLQHEKTVGELGLRESVIFTDFVSEGQLRWLYENCQAYVVPSLSEGFGLPGLEAMHYGAPVVSSNTTSLPEVYGDAAHYFDPLDPDDMAEKIAEVLNNKGLRTELKNKGSAQVKKYSWQRMAQETVEVYKKCLG